jgi:hypothetical protein
MKDIIIGRGRYMLRDLQEAKSAVLREDEPLFTYGTYNDDFAKELHLVSSGKFPVASVSVICPTSQIDRLLKHITIFPVYSFTIIPDPISIEAYEKIYNFMLYSPMSKGYVTWLSSLLLKPAFPVSHISVDEECLNIAPCLVDSCPLAAKGCSRGVIFPEVFNAYKGLPSDHDFNCFCDIQRKFSYRLAADLKKVDGNQLEAFEQTKKSLGIGHRYWIDPFRLYCS